jgi:hypothetical protein
MKRVRRMSIFLGLAAVCGLGAQEAGFTSLFNGKDLSGWRYPNMKADQVGSKTQTPDGRVEV